MKFISVGSNAKIAIKNLQKTAFRVKVHQFYAYLL